MFEPENSPPRLSSHSDEADIHRYRSVSKTAIAALAFGLASPLGLIHPLFWTLPCLALLFGGLAFWRIALDAPTLIGRRAAWIGLLLGLLFVTAGPTQWFAYRYMIRREAVRFTRQWFDFLEKNEPHKAYELTRHPDYRRPLSDTLLDFYAPDSDAGEELAEYLKNVEVHTLLELGDRAVVQQHQTPSQWQEAGKDALFQIYEITTPTKTKPLYLGILLERFRLKKPNRSGWRITNTETADAPHSFYAANE